MKAGDLQGFIDRNYDRIIGYAQKLYPCPHTAKVAVHDVLLKICTGWESGKFDHVQDMDAYLMTMVRNAVIDVQVQDRRHAHMPIDMAGGRAGGPDPLRYVIAREGVSRLLKLLAALPPAMSTTAHLYWWEGHSVKAIAQMLNCPLSTIRSRIRLIRKRAVQHLSNGKGWG